MRGIPILPTRLNFGHSGHYETLVDNENFFSFRFGIKLTTGIIERFCEPSPLLRAHLLMAAGCRDQPK